MGSSSSRPVDPGRSNATVSHESYPKQLATTDGYPYADPGMPNFVPQQVATRRGRYQTTVYFHVVVPDSFPRDAVVSVRGNLIPLTWKSSTHLSRSPLFPRLFVGQIDFPTRQVHEIEYK